LPAAAVLVSGIFELEPLIGTSIDRALGLTRDDCASISPLRHDGFSKVPTAVFWGEHETAAFKRQSQAWTAHLRRLGVGVTTSTEVPGRNHFDVILDLTTPQTALGDATIALIARTGLPPFATEI
jgi:arylformamidase